MKVFIHGAAATPVPVVEAMCKHGKNAGLRDVELMHIHTEGPGTYNKPEYKGQYTSLQTDSPVLINRIITLQLKMFHSIS